MRSVIKQNIFMALTSLPLFLGSLLLVGCMSVKPGSTKSGKQYFETFYVGVEGTQYFIKPLLFENDEANKVLALDITFRYKDEIRDSAIVNFSIKSLEIYKSVDSLKITNSLMDIKSDNIDLLFNEKFSKGFVSRFTTKVPLDKMKKIFDNDEWELTIHNAAKSNTYKPHRKTQKAVNFLRENGFILM